MSFGKGGLKHWRVRPKESLWHKLNKARKIKNLNRIEKGILLSVVLVVTFFSGAYFIYASNPSNLGKPGGPEDPWNTIWDGESPLIVGAQSATTLRINNDDFATNSWHFNRKTFYANNRYWVFFQETGVANTCPSPSAVLCGWYGTSSDGISWTVFQLPWNNTGTFLPADEGAWDLTVDGNNIYYAKYILGPTGTGYDNRNMAFRQGTLNADGTITWQAENIIKSGGGTCIYWITQSIAKATDGTIFVYYNRANGKNGGSCGPAQGPPTPRIIHSAGTNYSSWIEETNLNSTIYPTNTNSMFTFGQVIPFGTNAVYVVYGMGEFGGGSATGMFGRLITFNSGTNWLIGAQQTIRASAHKGFSITSDGTFIYGILMPSPISGDIQMSQIVRSATGAWTETLDVFRTMNGSSPHDQICLSHDAINNDLYVFNNYTNSSKKIVYFKGDITGAAIAWGARTTAWTMAFSGFGFPTCSSKAFVSTGLSGAASQIMVMYPTPQADAGTCTLQVSFTCNLYVGLLNTGSACPSGYNCFNAQQSSAGDIYLQPTNTQSAQVLSKTSMDLAITAGKELAIHQMWHIEATSSDYNPVFAWYLTRNGTLPNLNYNPLTDKLVDLIVIAYLHTTDQTINYYLYMRRELNNVGLETGTEDPFEAGRCPQNENLYLCTTGPMGNAGSFVNKFMSIVLNYTGGATGGAGFSGTSFLCGEFSSGATSTCAVGGRQNTAISALIPGPKINYTFPWFNINAGDFHVGFWMKSNSANVTPKGVIFNNAQPPNCSGAFCSNIISYFVPTATIVAPDSNVDTGGFFGWIGRALGSTWNALSSSINSVLSPILDFGSGLLNVFMAALIQSVGFFVKGFEVFFNWLGSLFGLGNIGTIIVDTFASIATIIAGGITATLNFFAAVIALASSTVFNFLSAAFSFFVIFIPILYTIWSIMFTINFSIATILFFDWAYGFWRLYEDGMAGLWEWVSFNRMIFTFIFEVTYYVVSTATDVILRVKDLFTGWI